MSKKNKLNNSGIYIFNNADDFITAMAEIEKAYNEKNKENKSNE